MKKFVLGMFLTSLLIPCSSECSVSLSKKATIKEASSDPYLLKIYNCEDYIYEDEETGVTMVDEFEEWYENTYNVDITVEYDTYATNETMYNQVVNLQNHYDIVVASDYMIEKMRNEGHLEKFDYSKLPNYTNYVSPYLKNIFDENGYTEYSTAYMWGTMGMIYNPEVVDEQDVKSWDIMWNKKYQNKISIKDSMRDTYILGIFRAYKHVFDLLREQLEEGLITPSYYNQKVNEYFNLCDDETISEVEYALKTLKENVYGFEVDSGKNDIVTGKIDINFAWSGDAVYAIYLAAEENDQRLCYSLPEEGSNVWFDGFAMPKGANTELAYAFINYLSDPENAVKNMDYIGYTTAIAGDTVIDYLHDCYDADESETDTFSLDLGYFFNGTISSDKSAVIVAPSSEKNGMLETQYPSEELLQRCGVMHDFGAQNEEVVSMWTRVRASDLSIGTYIFLGVILLGGVGFGIYSVVKKHKAKKRREACRGSKNA